MKRYLIIYIASGGDFCFDVLFAGNLIHAHIRFIGMRNPDSYKEIFSIQRLIKKEIE